MCEEETKKFRVTKKFQEEINKSNKELGFPEKPIKEYELNCLMHEDMQNSEVFLTKEEKEKIKSILEDKELIEEKELIRLKDLRSKSGLNSVVLGELYLKCHSNLFNNLNLFKDNEKNKLKSILNFDKIEELRNLLEDYGNGEEWGSHNTGEKIKDIVKLNRNQLTKLINLFFDVIEEE